MTTTINKEEIQKFSNLADEWWDVNGKFKLLICSILLGLNTLLKKFVIISNLGLKNNS